MFRISFEIAKVDKLGGLGLVLWFLVGLVVGLAGSVLLWQWMRKKGWLDAPWGWYRYFRWVWPVLLVPCLAFNSGRSLGDWKVGSVIRTSATDSELVVDGLKVFYGEVADWRGKNGSGSPVLDRELEFGLAYLEKMKDRLEFPSVGHEGDIGRVLGQKLVEAIEAQFRELHGDPSAGKKLAKAIAARNGGDEEALEEFAKNELAAGVTDSLTVAINRWVWSRILIRMAYGVGIPLLPLGIFWLARRRALPTQTPAAEDDGKFPA